MQLFKTIKYHLEKKELKTELILNILIILRYVFLLFDNEQRKIQDNKLRYVFFLLNNELQRIHVIILILNCSHQFIRENNFSLSLLTKKAPDFTKMFVTKNYIPYLYLYKVHIARPFRVFFEASHININWNVPPFSIFCFIQVYAKKWPKGGQKCTLLDLSLGNSSDFYNVRCLCLYSIDYSIVLIKAQGSSGRREVVEWPIAQGYWWSCS